MTMFSLSLASSSASFGSYVESNCHYYISFRDQINVVATAEQIAPLIQLSQIPCFGRASLFPLNLSCDLMRLRCFLREYGPYVKKRIRNCLRGAKQAIETIRSDCLRLLAGNVTKSARNCGFGHIYCRNP